jgi:anti-sigma factor ChrR (cupin superfamily)
MTASIVIDLPSLQWGQMVPGVEAKTLWVDEASNRRAMLVRFAAGAALARHVHTGDEVQFVLEGSVGDDYGTVTAGNLGYRPPGCTHTVRTETGGTALAIVSGGVKPVQDGTEGGPPSLVVVAADQPEVEGIPGVMQRTLWADEASGRRAVLSRFSPGAQIPRHRHDGDELIYVVDGALEDESGPVTAGNAGFRPDGCTHTVTSPSGATVFALVRGGIAPLG